MTVVILSGGSEIVAAALVEELVEAGLDLAVISLVGKSILRNAVPDMRYAELEWPAVSLERAAREIRDLLVGWGASADAPSPIFATEDGGLRLLLGQRDVLGEVGVFGGARSLGLGGLDKAELFNWLQVHGCADLSAPTVVVESIGEVSAAIAALGGDCVIKPSLKPLSMRLTGMSAKAFMSAAYPDQRSLLEALSRAWDLSRYWVIQTRLTTPATGEAVFWGARDAQGGLVGMTAVEHWKNPRSGGTGCWVRSHNTLSTAIRPLAERILEALDFVGICEIEFLLDVRGDWRLLEINPRPWLQVGLARAAGAPLARQAVRILGGGQVEPIEPRDGISWVNPERLVLAALSGEQGARGRALRTALGAWRGADSVAIYGSTLPCIKRRWLARMATKAWEHLRS